MQTTGQGACKTRTLGPERSSYPPFSSAFWETGSVMRDLENEEALCPTVQIKEVIACIASWTGKGTKGNKQIKRQLKMKAKESPSCSLFPFCECISHKFLRGFYTRCKMKKILCPCYRSVGWKRKMHRSLTTRATCKLLGLLYLCGRKHHHPNSALRYIVLFMNVLIVTIQVNEDSPDDNRN